MGKIAFYLKNDKAREKIANAGLIRVLKDRHEVTYRAKQIVDTSEQFRRE